MALFYGARHQASEWSYGDEFEAYQKEGVLTHIFHAWSRDQEKKIYLPQRLAENQELVFKLLHEDKGYFYYCGTGGSVPGGIRKLVIESIQNVGGYSKEYAEKYVTDMQLAGRYNIEAW